MAEVAEIIARVSAKGVEESRAKLRQFRDEYRGVGDDTGDAASRMDVFGRKATAVGSVLSRHVTLPLLALGGVATATFTGFESSMSQIEGLVGVAGSEVERMGEQVKALGPAVGQGPTKLADAMFVVQSAGIRGAAAMELLEQSGKAATAGMGETVDVARAGTAAMNAYGTEVLSGTEAVDVLTATARAGNFEVSGLASSIGNVVPVAAAAGVELDEVGATIALLTRNGASASEAVTQTRSVIQALLAPSAQGAKILGDMGVSTDEVARSMSEDGLLGTLRMLDDGLGGNTEQFSKLLGSTEALNAALTLTRGDASTVTGVFQDLANSAGITNEAFEAVADDAGFKLKRSFAEAQVALVDIGDTVGPVAADVIGFASGAVSAFSDLPPELQNVVLGLGGIAAAAGPAASAVGGVVSSISSARTAVSAAGGLMPALGGAASFLTGPWGLALGAAGIAAVALGGNFIDAAQDAQRLREQVRSIGEAVDGTAEAITLNGPKIQEWLTGSDDAPFAGVVSDLAELGITGERVNDVITGGPQAIARFRDEMLGIGEAAGISARELGAVEAEMEGIATGGARRGRNYSDEAQGIIDVSEATDSAVRVLQEYSRQQIEGARVAGEFNDAIMAAAIEQNTENGVTDWIGAMQDADRVAADAQGEVHRFAQRVDGANAALRETAEPAQVTFGAIESIAAAMSEGQPAFDDYLDAVDTLVGHFYGIENVDARVTQAMADFNEVIAENGAGLDVTTEAGRENLAALQELATEYGQAHLDLANSGPTYDEYTTRLQAMRDEYIEAAVSAGESRERAEELADELFDLPNNISIPVKVITATAEQLVRNLQTNLANLEGRTYRVPVQVETVTVDGTTYSGTNSHRIAQTIGGFRAEGGPVSAGVPYVVGEDGIELFTPDTDGYIVSNDDLTGGRGRSGGGFGGGQSIVINVNAPVGADLAATGMEIVKTLQAAAGDFGPLPLNIRGGA
ncbi:MAG: phage tail tape measure protein [Actinomycetota bacterium]|nr:phage tail tape measure protein [Actinomycetota bacterium]